MTRQIKSIFLSAVSLLCLSLGKEQCLPKETILFLPLDERFTTRNAFLNLAKTTAFCIVTPPSSMLPSLKENCDLSELHEWVDSNIHKANTAIISSEMYLYGGLITSRTSNDTTAQIQQRVNKLMTYSANREDLDLYISNVVMRIPAYNGDFEEPWYWADYGYDLFSYSFYMDKYNQLGSNDDLITAQNYQSLVPMDIVNEFAWRRERNHNITVNMINAMRDPATSPFKYLYITLDDNAEYGFNIREAASLKSQVAGLGLAEAVPIYPGADEVQLALLAKLASTVHGRSPRLAIVYHHPSSVNNIPNYEGQSMRDTLFQQISAAGGTPVEVATPTQALLEADALLLVNNFAIEKQAEAPNQSSQGNVSEYAMFTPFVEKALGASRVVPVGFCDNKYSNGGDIVFVAYMQSLMSSSSMKNMAYAGWNTNGNTIGTVVSNTVLLSINALKGKSQHDSDQTAANQIFNSLRVLEDLSYQASSRQTLSNFADSLDSEIENSSNLASDLNFYERFSYKLLAAKYEELAAAYGLQLKLASIYYPWNRTFEIGLVADSSQIHV